MSPAPAVRLWLVRHGETPWARDRRHTGRTDVPLTDRGREQAAALAPRLRDVRFAAVRCSPLLRARSTLELALPGSVPALDDDLRERDYGAAEGRTTDELQDETPGWSSWSTPIPGAETIDEVGTRADRAIAAAVEAGPPPAGDAGGTADPSGKDADGPGADPAATLPGLGDPGPDVLIVAHGHLLRILAARWLGRAPASGAQLLLSTGSLSVLGAERGVPAVLRWNA